jgi:hypothetical protein
MKLNKQQKLKFINLITFKYILSYQVYFWSISNNGIEVLIEMYIQH